MTRRSGVLGATAVSAAMLTLSVSAPSASAAFGVSKWEAGTCNVSNCNYGSPKSTFFTQVAGRPPFGITDFTFNTNGLGIPEGQVRDVRVDLPPGLSVNPQATSAQCTEAQVASTSCPAGPQVGTSKPRRSTRSGIGVPISAPSTTSSPNKVSQPSSGSISACPLLIDITVFLQGSVHWESDYHEGFTIREIPNSVPLARNSLIFEGQAGNGSFITVGSNCRARPPTGLSVDSHQNPGNFLHYDTTPIQPVETVQPTGCGSVPFTPGVSTNPGTNQTDSPTGGTVTATVPFNPGANIGQSNVKRAEVSLPNGMGLNPAAAKNLKFCTDAQLGKGKAIGDLSRTTNPAGVHPPPIGCPAASKIGTVSIETPVLPAGSLPGTVYLGEQLSRNPLSGKEYRIFVNAESRSLRGLRAADRRSQSRPGHRPADRRLRRSGPRRPAAGPVQLLQPAVRRRQRRAHQPADLRPQHDHLDDDRLGREHSRRTRRASFTLTNAPGGGACAKTMAERPFAPGVQRQTGSRQRRSTFTPFPARIIRPDGQQELKGVDITLPPGATAKLAGVPYCTADDIADAAARRATNEQKNPSCPDEQPDRRRHGRSRHRQLAAQIDGKAYLAGPYKGAPLSLVVITPAIAGPFDLGTVVVRVPLFLESGNRPDPPGRRRIPDVFGGAKLDIRSVFVNVNRNELHPQRDQLPQMRDRRHARAAAGPTRPTRRPSRPSRSPTRSSCNGCGKLTSARS